MKEHEKLLNDQIKAHRMADKLERPMVWGKRMDPLEYTELIKFTYTLAESLHKGETPLTQEELFGMCLASAKYALEEYTTRKPALRREI